MAEWIIHLDDGNTITDVLPHKLPAEYTQDRITSVERVIEGLHLTVKKSPWLYNYFMMVDADIMLKLFGGKAQSSPPKIALKNIGGYVKDAMILTDDGKEAHLQFRFGMHPRTGDGVLEFLRVNKVTPVGINVRRINPLPKGKPRFVYRHVIDGRIYTVFGSIDIETAEVEDDKFIVTLVNGRVVTLTVSNGDITLEIV